MAGQPPPAADFSKRKSAEEAIALMVTLLDEVDSEWRRSLKVFDSFRRHHRLRG